MSKLFSRIDAWDRSAMAWVVPRRRDLMTKILRLYTASGTGRAWLILAAVFGISQLLGWAWVPEQEPFFRSMVAAVLAWALGSVAKRVFRRPRPFETMTGYETKTKLPTCRSFPSSHAASSVAFATTLLLIHHPLAPEVALWAALVTYSRYYLGVHYPTDLFGGVVFGIVCGAGLGPLLFILS